jgi:hypothetical protein
MLAVSNMRNWSMKTRRRADDFVPEGMKHSDFRVGVEFLTGSGRWRCTDVGKRTIVAIRLDKDHDPAWYNGPPYAVVESVFDEYDLEGLSPAPKRRTHDESGRHAIVTLRRAKAGIARKALKKRAK